MKYVRLYRRAEAAKLYAQRGERAGTQAQGNISAVDVQEPDLSQFPRFAEAEFEHVIMMQGDMLYIPARCWHFVKSLTTSISVNFWF